MENPIFGNVTHDHQHCPEVEIVYEETAKGDGESLEREGKRLKVLNEKKRIFFVVDHASPKDPDCKVWYEIDLDDLGSVRRLEKEPPVSSNIHALGSCGSFLYSLGGMTCSYSDPLLPYLSTPLDKNYLYNTSKPEEGWFEGPPMCSPRYRLSHHVIGSKIYALGGASVSNDYYVYGWDLPTLVWGEYLDVSLPRGEWKWRPVKTSFTCGNGNGILDDVDFILSLPLFKGGFDPERHILCSCDTDRGRFLVYNVDDGSLCRVLEECHVAFNRPSPYANVFVEGDCIVTPDSTRVFVLGTFRRHDESQLWFVGGVHSDYSNHFPPLPRDLEYWFLRNPDLFSLVRIAPTKYAALWVPEVDKPFVNLSVFTVIFPSPSGGCCCLDNLDKLLRSDILCVDDVQAIFETEHAVRIPLLDFGKFRYFNIKAAVAM